MTHQFHLSAIHVNVSLITITPFEAAACSCTDLRGLVISRCPLFAVHGMSEWVKAFTSVSHWIRCDREPETPPQLAGHWAHSRDLRELPQLDISQRTRPTRSMIRSPSLCRCVKGEFPVHDPFANVCYVRCAGGVQDPSWSPFHDAGYTPQL